MITAPYNFVPLNKEVFYPEWSNNGNEISHDVPFSDGASGVIDITITAKSPIFIRNHSKDKDKLSEEFCHSILNDGSKQYYIPGSSIKGIVRSVLEILSFGKMKVDEARLKKSLSIRDMTPNSRNNPLFNHSMVGVAQKCGFLVEDGDKYKIEECGKVLTISYGEISKATGQQIQNHETAKAKYEHTQNLSISFKKTTKMMDVRGKQLPKDIAIFDTTSTNIGTLVFTGKIDNKKNEFIFKSNGQKRDINKTVFDDFKKVYFDNEDSIDGQYWKAKWQNGGGQKVPVFYIEEDGKIDSIGLTQLFKLAYNKTLYDAICQDRDNKKPDLAETMFGSEKDGLALKGRVVFGHLKSNVVRFEPSKTVEQVLGSPNPTYYPNYIRQVDIANGKVNKYTTLMDKNAQISGWKRYPLQDGIQSYKLPTDDSGKVNHDVATKFRPLDSGTEFTGKIVFHNLKKAEIGALLSALTFHGQGDKYLHNIGMAKSLGYGKIQIKLTSKNPIHSQGEYLKEFENEITKTISNWKSSPQLTELFAMADSSKAKALKYQLLENHRKENEFTNAKKAREYLHSSSGNTYKSECSEKNQLPTKQEPQQPKTAAGLADFFKNK
jgi:CRISPR-associated protein (TIGR03986 family)